MDISTIALFWIGVGAILTGIAVVLAENTHPFEDPPLRMNNSFG